MTRKPPTFRVGRETWTLHEFGEIDGLCIPADREIYVDETLSGGGKILAVLHEALHAAAPGMSEPLVDRISRAQSQALRALCRHERKGTRRDSRGR